MLQWPAMFAEVPTDGGGNSPLNASVADRIVSALLALGDGKEVIHRDVGTLDRFGPAINRSPASVSP